MRDLKKASTQITHYDYVETPIGPILLAGCEHYLRFAGFSQGSQKRTPLESWRRDTQMFSLSKQQFSEYFDGSRTVFTVPIKLSGSDFQRAVWAALRNVAYGQTRSYGDIAAAINNAKASRAVGGANNANPIPIIVPCHRIIGVDKSMTGFGGGISVKEFLLDIEGSLALRTPDLFQP